MNRGKGIGVAIFAALADGPKPTKAVIDELAAIVPPGRAFRYATREYASKGHVNKNAERVIAAGQRALVRNSLHAMRQKGTIDQYMVDGVRYAALTEAGVRRAEKYRGERPESHTPSSRASDEVREA